MTPLKRSVRSNAAVLTGIVLLSGCGTAATGETGAPEPISIAIGEPVSPLLTANTVEENGTQVLESLFTGLVEYDTDGAVRYTGVAEDIESEDSVTWTVRLREGWSFHDGTPVTAESFVDAWNYAAYSPNAQEGSYFFANIEGFGDLQAPTDEEGEPTGDPAATELSGLRVVDDETFTVTLSAPFAQFPVTLGYNPFFPLPEAFYEDPEAFGVRPIGNGPFRAAGDFVSGEGITVLAYEDFAGEQPASVEAVEFRVYGDTDTAYLEAQSGDLDVLPRIPADVAGTAPDEFEGRYVESAASGFTFLGLPLYRERYADPRVRQALSLAIDRETIADKIFSGTRLAAASVVPPVVEGHRADACDACVLDVDRANELLDEAGFDRTQPIELWFNAGTGNEDWMEAIGNQLRSNLGVEFVLKGELAPPEYGPLLGAQGMFGPFRMGWAMDYPSPQNFLEPLYATDAGANFSFYSNPAFDELVAKGNAAATSDEAIGFYNQAEDVLLEDMPIIPLFFDVTQSVHSADVEGVVVDAFGRVDTTSLTAVG
ncbi:ABC transporter substrate-binding protein [Blastococcus sp. CT_GayMR19]|uniref:peptide ABC transporter substrate-binding protein n=1 Tax=Blastococcus sp. CT_GayMR19 TaxID=2559608 RepID=UPI001073313A|nr:ABC transporter substrate-binding protein [Blastococcus sp. CT_GayMR19]TFV73384.1 ABC transporter substrate-binding protein [Blastococcus sp. CT_GayMR19]